MSDAAPTVMIEKVKDDDLQLPRLHPAPGRCIVRIVPRLLQTQTSAGVMVDLDGRYENQPMLGQLVEIGDPTNTRETTIANWAIDEHEKGNLFVFSMYGAGSPYWNDEMRKMLPSGFDFRWLQGLRLFDIGQLSATVSGSGMYGEKPGANGTYSEKVLAPDPDEELQ
jgi:hypothetical protein